MIKIKIDNNDLTEFDLFVLRDHENPLLPGTRDNFLQVPGMQGAHDMGSNIRPKPFNIPLGFRPQTSYEELRYKGDQFVKLLLDDYGNPKTVKLEYNYYPDRYWMVKYSGQLPLQRLVNMAQFNLPLIAPKPKALSNVETHEIHWDSEEVTFDDTYLFGATAIEDVQITSNQILEAWANWYAVRPTLLINGSGENVTFRCNGKSFSLKDFTNSTFEINGENYTVIKNGANGFNQKIGKDFLELLPGENEIEVTGNNMNFNLSVRVRDQHA